MQDGVTRDSPRRSKREPTNRENELGQDDRPGYDQEREERLEEADGSVDLPSEHAGHAARGAGHGAPGASHDKHAGHSAAIFRAMAVGAVAMSASTIVVAGNAQLLRRLRLRSVPIDSAARSRLRPAARST